MKKQKQNQYSIHKFGDKLLQKYSFPHLEKYVAWRTGQDDFLFQEDKYGFAPISINLDLTTACSFACQHCIDKKVVNRGKALNLDYIKGLISVWIKNGLRSVIVIGGGEPCLYPRFEEVIRFLKKHKLQIGIVSNGSCQDKIARVAHLLDRKDWVRFSIDAGTNETFQKIHSPRLQCGLDVVLKGAKVLSKKNPKLQIGFSFLVIGRDKVVDKKRLANNIEEIALAAQLAKDNGFTYFSVKPFIAVKGKRPTTMGAQDLQLVKKEIGKAKKLETEKFRVIESINLLALFDKRILKIMKHQPKICHAQFFRSVVIPDGIFQCSLWRGFNEAKVIGVNKKVNKEYLLDLHRKRLAMIDKFNAGKICAAVNCLYSPFNTWVEQLIKSPAKFKKLKLDNTELGDYFL